MKQGEDEPTDQFVTRLKQETRCNFNDDCERRD